MKRVALVLASALIAATLGVALASTLEGANATSGVTTLPAAAVGTDEPRPRCVVPVDPRGRTVSGGRAPAAPIAALRRPRTPEDELPADIVAQLRSTGSIRAMHPEAARRLPTVEGEPPQWAVPVDDVAQPLRLDERCLDALPERAARRARTAFRRRASDLPVPGLMIYPPTDGRVWNRVANAQIAAGTVFGRRPCAGPAGRMVAVEGLVPDGVSEVHVLLEGGRRIDVAVKDNFASVLVPSDDQHRLEAVTFTAPAGERHVTFDRLSHSLRCSIPSPIALGRPVLDASLAGEGGQIEVRTTKDPVLAGMLWRPLKGRRCLVVGPPLAATVDLERADIRCAENRRVTGARVTAEVFRLPTGDMAVAGFAGPRVRRVELHGVVTGVVRPSPSGAFLFTFARRVQPGTEFQLAVTGDDRDDRRSVKLTYRGGRAAPYAMPASVNAFSVFQRPRILADLYPIWLSPQGHGQDALTWNGRMDVRGARSLRSGLWLLPGRTDLCLMAMNPNGSAGGGCTTASSASTGRRPMGMRTDRRGDGRVAFVHVMPDGVRDVRLRLTDGSSRPVRVQGNLVSIDLRDPLRPERLTWSLADGTPARFTYPRDMRNPPR